jgi:hypothetical protein
MFAECATMLPLFSFILRAKDEDHRLMHRVGRFCGLMFTHQVVCCTPSRHASLGTDAPSAAFVSPYTPPGEDAAVMYDDPTTWPATWTAADIKRVLEPHLIRADKQLNYASLSLLLHAGDLTTISVLLGSFIVTPPPREIDIEKYLATYLDSNADSASMHFVDQPNNIGAVESALSYTYHFHSVAACSSPRGSGKTQMIKSFVWNNRADAMRCGRVIVRCCKKSSAGWMDQVLKGNVDQGLCDLVRMHVQSVTGRVQQAAAYSTPRDAYASWISTTEKYFNCSKSMYHIAPLIVLDSCEVLTRPNNQTIFSKYYGRMTLLQAFCFAVPKSVDKEHFGVIDANTGGIFVAGTDAWISHNDYSEVFCKEDRTTNVSLGPLWKDGHMKAVRYSWKMEIDADVRAWVYHLAGGVPRLLRLAHEQHMETMSLACGSLDALQQCFTRYEAAARAAYPLDAEWFPYAYTCLLASSTKARVGGTIYVDPAWCKCVAVKRTYAEASSHSIGSDTRDYTCSMERFEVPPITICDADAAAMMQQCPILPSQLHPFLSADVVRRGGTQSAADRDWLFEKPFVYAVYARYLLAYLEDRTRRWVPLQDVFHGAFVPQQAAAVKRYEVNLSAGVTMGARDGVHTDAAENAVTYLGGAAQHDAYLWCRDTADMKPFAAPMQLRCALSKRVPKEQREQAEVERHSMDAAPAPFLFRVEGYDPARIWSFDDDEFDDECPHFGANASIILINAKEMSSVCWLLPVSLATASTASSKKE